MTKAFVLSAAIILLLFAGALPASAEYYEWRTNKPFSGFVGIGPRQYYCDYIRYPKRVCDHDRYGNEVNCRVVGWDIRQHCGR